MDGEIYISLYQVRDNVIVFMSSLNKEFHRVIFHGALHLCGYKDKSPKEESVMRETENKDLDPVQMPCSTNPSFSREHLSIFGAYEEKKMDCPDGGYRFFA